MKGGKVKDTRARIRRERGSSPTNPSKNKRGKVIIQTSDHRHPVIQKVVQNDFASLYTYQLQERKSFQYPPYVRLIEITIRHHRKDITDEAATGLATLIKKTEGIQVIGPEYPVISRIRKFYLKSMLVKISPAVDLIIVKEKLQTCIAALTNNQSFRSVQVITDVDPY